MRFAVITLLNWCVSICATERHPHIVIASQHASWQLSTRASLRRLSHRQVDIVVVYIAMAYTVMADVVMAYTDVALVVMAYIAMANIVIAYKGIAYIVIAFIVLLYRMNAPSGLAGVGTNV